MIRPLRRLAGQQRLRRCEGATIRQHTHRKPVRAEAIEVLRGSKIDLVVVDYAMPGMKGHELAVKIKELHPHIPVVMQSGTIDLPETVTRTVDAFVPKGSDIYLLLTAVSNLITKTRISRRSSLRR